MISFVYVSGLKNLPTMRVVVAKRRMLYAWIRRADYAMAAKDNFYNNFI